jgi:PAS domain S-box-containing protein
MPVVKSGKLFRPTRSYEVLSEQKESIREKWKQRVANELAFVNQRPLYLLLDSISKIIDQLILTLKHRDSKSSSKEIGQASLLSSDSTDLSLEQLLAEYRILRQVIFETLDQFIELTRSERDTIFDFLQHAKMEAAKQYAERISQLEVEATHALKRTEVRLKLALDAANMGVWEWDLRTGALVWSDRMLILWNYSPEEFSGTIDNFWARIHPDDRDQVMQAIEGSTHDHQSFDIKYRVVWPDQSVHWIDSQGKASLDSSGKVVQVAGVAYDVTEREEYRQKLKESEEVFRLASRATQNLIWDWDFVTDQVRWHGEVAKNIGSSAAITKTDANWWYERIHPSDRDRVINGIHAVIDQGDENWHDEYEFRREDGTYFPVVDRGYVIRDANGKAVRMVGAMQDVTAQKATLDALRTSEKSFRTLADSMPQIVWTARADGFLDWYNQLWYDYTGAAPGSRWNASRSPVHPDDIEPTRKRWKEALQTGTLFEMELRFRRKSDGQYRWHLSRAIPLKDESGFIIKWIGTSTDVHDQKVLLAELKSAQERLALALKASQVGIFDYNLTTGKVTWTREEAEIFGYPPDRLQVEYSDVQSRIHAEDMDMVNRAIEKARDQKQDYRAEFRVIWPDGSIHWLFGIGKVVFDSQGKATHLMGSNLDVTERREVLESLKEERELRERFVFTLTHDLRTPLTSAKMNIQLASRKANDPDAVLSHSVKAVGALQRADKMIQDLLDASRIRVGIGLTIEAAECDMAKLVREVCDELTAANGVQIKLQVPPSVIGVWSCSELRRAIENLGSNAVKYGDPSRPIEVNLLQLEDQVKFSIHNYGNPIPPSDLPKIFESFRRATTSEGKSKGWGLGLSLVKGVIEAHGGQISVQSDPVSGTVFSFQLPIHQAFLVDRSKITK